MLLWFVFCVSGKVAKVLKMLVFCFVGCLILVYLGLEGLGVFVFLVYNLFFFVVLFCCSIVFGVVLVCV